MCCIYLYACYVYNYMYIYWNQVVFFLWGEGGEIRDFSGSDPFCGGGRFLFVKAHSSPIHLPRIQKSIPEFIPSS